MTKNHEPSQIDSIELVSSDPKKIGKNLKKGLGEMLQKLFYRMWNYGMKKSIKKKL